MQDLRQELQEKAEQYFGSVDTAFQFSLGCHGSANPVDRIMSFAIGVFFFSLFPLIPLILYLTVPRVLGKTWPVIGDSVPLEFVLWWIVSFFVSVVVLFSTVSIGVRLEARRRSKQLTTDAFRFCLVYGALKEIKAFAVNQRQAHLKTAYSLLAKYVSLSDLRIDLSEFAAMAPKLKDAMDTMLDVPGVIKALTHNLCWFKVEDVTALVSEGYSRFHAVVLERLLQGVEVDKTEAALKNLSLYEYSRIANQATHKLTESNFSIAVIGRECLIEFAKVEATLSDLPKRETGKEKRSISALVQKATLRTSALLRHPNLLVCFLSWYVVLLLVIVPVATVTMRLLAISIDSTILIGLISAPFVAAVAFANTVHTRRGR